MTQTLMLDRRALMASFAALAMPAIGRAATVADYPTIKAMMDGYVASKKLPGLVCAIKRGDDAVQYLSAGTLAFDTDKPATPDSIYRVYSMTKPMVGMMVMKLIEEGKLTLDTPLSDILPDFKDMKVIADPKTGATRPATRPILIRNLLTHTSGLSYSINQGPTAQLYIKNGIVPGSRDVDKAPGADFAPARDLETFGKRLATLPLDFDPGAKWQYSVAIDVLGLVIQRVSGMPFNDYMHKNLWKPLGMKDTDFMVPKNKLDRFTSVIAVQDGKRVVAEDRKNSPFARDRDLPSGGGGSVSTARDYIRFLSMMINEGSLDGHRIVKPETVRLARSNLMPSTANFFGNGYGAAMAVQLRDTPNGLPKDAYWWFGIAGTQMWMDPNNKIAVCLMLQENPTSDPVQNEIRAAAYKDFKAIKA